MNKNNISEFTPRGEYYIRNKETGKTVSLLIDEKEVSSWKSIKTLKKNFFNVAQAIFESQSEFEILKEEGRRVVLDIKGLYAYSKENVEILIKAYSEEDIEAYVKIDTARKDKTYTVEYQGNDIFVNVFKGKGGMILISRTNFKFQLTSHTLYSLCQELEIKPSNFKEVK